MDRTDGQGHFVSAAGLMDMAGWMAYDTGRPDLAEAHFRRALRFVEVGRDDQLHGHIYSGLSHLAHHVGASRDAIELARAGHRALGSGRRRPQLHARLLTMQARGHAALQDAEECARLLKQAERTLSQPADEEPSVWVSAFDDGAFTSEAATCMQSLGQVRSAEQHARRVIELRPRHRPRSRALGQLSLVSALLAQGRAEEACEVAADILSTTASLRLTVVLDRLGELHAQLEQHRLDRSVADFLECLRTTLHERERQA
jgi:tetratricopeptide (TPR) repeat protein